MFSGLFRNIFFKPIYNESPLIFC